MFECNQEELKTGIIGKGFDFSSVWGKDEDHKELDLANEEAENKTVLNDCNDHASSEEPSWKDLLKILHECNFSENVHADEEADTKEKSDIQSLVSQTSSETSDEDSDSMDDETIEEAPADRKESNEEFEKRFEILEPKHLFSADFVWGKDKDYKEPDFANEDAENKTVLNACNDHASSEEASWKDLLKILHECNFSDNVHADEEADTKEKSDIQSLVSQTSTETSDEDSDSMDDETFEEAPADRKESNEEFEKRFEILKEEREKRRWQYMRCTAIKRANPNYSSSIIECQIIQEFLIVLELLRTAVGRGDLNAYDLELSHAAGDSSITFKIHHSSVQSSFWLKMMKALKQIFKTSNAHCVFDLTDDVLKLTFKIKGHDLSLFESEESRTLILDCLNSSVDDILKSSLEHSQKTEIDVVNEILDADLDELLWANRFSCQERMAYTKILDY